MHIAPGIIDPIRLAVADAAALTLVARQLGPLPASIGRLRDATIPAAICAALMQAWHLPVGPSELHLTGATFLLLRFGARSAILGVGLGLLVQAILLEPVDLPHIGVNFLSLALPIWAASMLSRRLAGKPSDLATFVRADAVVQTGVCAMVGFWLWGSSDAAPLWGWLLWSAASVPLFLLESVLGWAALVACRTGIARRVVALIAASCRPRAIFAPGLAVGRARGFGEARDAR